MKHNENKSALWLIDDKIHRSWDYPNSGWDADYRGANKVVTKEDEFPERRALSVRKGYPTTLKRDITEQFCGKITFETMFRVSSGDGFYMFFGNSKEEAFKIIQCGEYFYAGNVKLFSCDTNKHYIKINLDMDLRQSEIYLDGGFAEKCNFTGNADSISTFKCGYGNDDLGEAFLSDYVKMYKDFLVNDMVVNMMPGELPCDYLVNVKGNANVSRKVYSDTLGECVYAIKTTENDGAKVAKTFDKSSGNVCFEIKYYIEKKSGKLSLGMYSGKRCAVEICDEFTEIYSGNSVLKKHSENVWQTLRIEADTDKKSALIRLNGKKVTTLSFEENVDFIDSISINFDSAEENEVNFADIYVFVIPPCPEDYVPEPVVPEKKGDYYVGMNICSLWRTGDHKGWDCITPYDELKPVIGYYDEGNPETADWEIKFMAEHGIDFECYCWYAPESDAPFRFSQLSNAIHNGHMLAKYSDKVRIALLWEAANAAHPASREAFRKYYVPYWIDYFFSDERYMTIDNKAVMSVYSSGVLNESFGSDEAVKEELDYLRSEVKKLGYDDLIIMTCGTDSNPQMKAHGLDGVHAYSWGPNGYDLNFTKMQIKHNMDLDNLYVIPTISTGYNHVGWGERRTPSMIPEDFKKGLEWCKDELLTKNDSDSWKSKLVMLSTWNEYGEGTYIMPCADHNGFGYLDAVRSVFRVDKPHTDVVPTENQLKRINVLHPIGRAKLTDTDHRLENAGEYGIYKKYEFKTEKDLELWEFHGFSSLRIEGGKLIGHSDTFNPYMLLKDKDFLPLDSEKVGAVRVHIRAYKPVNSMCMIQLYCSNSPCGTLSPKDAYVLTDPDKIVPLTINLRREPKLDWSGNITAIRFDPIYAVGDFELVDIEFLSAPIHKVVYINGTSVKTTQYAKQINGKTYICFDTNSTLAKNADIYYEFDKKDGKLTIFGKKQLVITLGSDIALLDTQEIKLEAQTELSDGLPFISAQLYAKAIGYDCNETEDAVYFTDLKCGGEEKCK